MTAMARPHDEEPPPFLGSEPPPLAARGLSLIIITLFLVSVVLASVIQVPETVSSTFVLVPLRGVDPIRAPRAGRVLQVLATESARAHLASLGYEIPAPRRAEPDMPALWDDVATG